MNPSPALARLRRLFAGLSAGLSAGLLVLAVLPGCGTGNDDPPAPDVSTMLAPAQAADVAVLMMGNSHTFFARLPERLQAALSAALPGRRVAVVVAPDNLFLDEHLADRTTRALLAGHRWQAVVLQAQKYSSSGLVNYSTAEAEQLVRLARAQGAVPVMYPEWARQGIDETDRIWELHTGIARRVPACVAPVPQAWDRALAADPGLPLHASDGNHAAAAGGLLTALVLMGTITGLEPASLPGLPDLPGAGTAPLQARLRTAAAAALLAEPARRFCPADPVLR